MATINPYDPEKHVWIVDDWADQIFEFTHEARQLVKGRHLTPAVMLSPCAGVSQ